MRAQQRSPEGRRALPAFGVLCFRARAQPQAQLEVELKMTGKSASTSRSGPRRDGGEINWPEAWIVRPGGQTPRSRVVDPPNGHYVARTGTAAWLPTERCNGGRRNGGWEMKRIGVLAVVAVVGAAILAPAAFAHTSNLTVKGVCNPATGKYRSDLDRRADIRHKCTRRSSVPRTGRRSRSARFCRRPRRTRARRTSRKRVFHSLPEHPSRRRSRSSGTTTKAPSRQRSQLRGRVSRLRAR